MWAIYVVFLLSIFLNVEAVKYRIIVEEGDLCTPCETESCTGCDLSSAMSFVQAGSLEDQDVIFDFDPGVHIANGPYTFNIGCPTGLHFIGQAGVTIHPVQCTLLNSQLVNFTSVSIYYQIDSALCSYSNKFFIFNAYDLVSVFEDCYFLINTTPYYYDTVISFMTDSIVTITNCTIISQHRGVPMTFIEMYNSIDYDFVLTISDSKFIGGFSRVVDTIGGDYASTIVISDSTFISEDVPDLYYSTTAIYARDFQSMTVTNCNFIGWGEAISMESTEIYYPVPAGTSSTANIVSCEFHDNLQQHFYSYLNLVNGIISSHSFSSGYTSSYVPLSAFISDCEFVNNSSPVIESRGGQMTVSSSIFISNKADNYQSSQENSNGIISAFGNRELSGDVDEAVVLVVDDCLFALHEISCPIISATVNAFITVSRCEFADNWLFNTWRGGVVSVYDNNQTIDELEQYGPTAIIIDSIFKNNWLTVVEGYSDSYYYGGDDDGNGVKNDYDFTNQSTGGGAIHVHNSPAVVIEGCHFENNSAVVERIGSNDDNGLLWQTVAVGGAVFLAGVEEVTIKENSFIDNSADTSGGALYIHSCGLPSGNDQKNIRVSVGPGNIFHYSNSVFESDDEMPYGIHLPFLDTAPYDGNDVTIIQSVSSALFGNYFLMNENIDYFKRIRIADSYIYWAVNAIFVLSRDFESIESFDDLYDPETTSFAVNIRKWQIKDITSLPDSFGMVSDMSMVQVLNCADYTSDVGELFNDQTEGAVIVSSLSDGVTVVSACPLCSEGKYGLSSHEGGMRWIMSKGILTDSSKVESSEIEGIVSYYGSEDLPLANECADLCSPLSNELQLELGCSECPVPYSCLGGKLCRTGFSGLLCGSCMNGYYTTNKTCQPCESSGYALLGGAIVLVVLIYVFRRSKVTANQFVRLKILSTFAQMVMITTFIAIQWPPFIQAFINILGAIGLFLQAPQAECVVSMSVFDRSLATFLLFLSFLLVLLSFDYIYGKLALGNLRQGTLEKSQQCFGKQLQFRRVFFLVMTAAYSSVLAACLQGLICTTTSDGQRVLLADPEVDCGSQAHNDLIVLCAFSLIIFGCGIPVFLTYTAISVASYRNAVMGKRQLSRRSKSELAHFLSWVWGFVLVKSGDSSQESLLGRWMTGWGLGDKRQGAAEQSRPVGAFSEGYSFESLWFEIASLIRKALVVIIVFSVISPVEQAVGSYVVNSFYLVLLLAYSPLRFLPMKLFSAVVNVNNVLEAVAGWILVINQVVVLHIATVPYGTAELLGIGFFILNIVGLLIFVTMFERGMRKLAERRKGLYVVSTIENLSADWKFYNEQLQIALMRKEYLVAQSCIDDIEEVSDELLLGLMIKKRDATVNVDSKRMTMRIDVQSSLEKLNEKGRIDSIALSSAELDQIELDIRVYLKNKDTGQREENWKSLEANLTQLAEKTRDTLDAECEKERKNACKLWMNATKRRRGSADSLISHSAAQEESDDVNVDNGVVRQTSEVSEYAQLNALRDRAAELILYDISDMTQQILYDMDMSDYSLTVSPTRIGSALYKASSIGLFIMFLSSLLVVTLSFENSFYVVGSMSSVSLTLSLAHCALNFTFISSIVKSSKQLKSFMSRYSIYWAVILLIAGTADLDILSANDTSSTVLERKSFVFSMLVTYLIGCFIVHSYCRGMRVERLIKVINSRRMTSNVADNSNEGIENADGWFHRLKRMLLYCPEKMEIPRVWIFRSLPTFYDRICLERLGWLILILGMIQLPIAIVLGNGNSWGSSVAAGSWYSGLSAMALGLLSIEMRTFWKSDAYRVTAYTFSLISTISCLTGFLCDLLSSVVFRSDVTCTSSQCSSIVVIDIILLFLLLSLTLITTRLCKSRRIPIFLNLLDKRLSTDSFVSIAADISSACVKLHQTRHETEILIKSSRKKKVPLPNQKRFWSFGSNSTDVSSPYKNNTLEFNMVDDDSDSEVEETVVKNVVTIESKIELTEVEVQSPKRKPNPPPVPPPRRLLPTNTGN